MTVRQRPINWSLLLNPTSQGLQAEVDSSRNLANAVLGAGSDIGGGIIRGRQERESKRRFDTAQQLSRDEFSLRKEEFEERKRERQANESAILDALTVASDTVQAEAATTGQVSPQTGQALGQLTDAAGGPQIATEKIAAREAGAAPAVEDLPSLDLFGRADEANRRREVARDAMEMARKTLNPNGLKKPEDRAKARLAYQTAFNAWTKADADYWSAYRRAGQAKQREDLALTTEAARVRGEAEAAAHEKARIAQRDADRERKRRDMLEVYADRGLPGDPARLTFAELEDRLGADDEQRKARTSVATAVKKDELVGDPNRAQAEASRLAREGRRSSVADAALGESQAEDRYDTARRERERLEDAIRDRRTNREAREAAQNALPGAKQREADAATALETARQQRREASKQANPKNDQPPPGLPAEALAEWNRLSPEGKAAVRAKWGK